MPAQSRRWFLRTAVATGAAGIATLVGGPWLRQRFAATTSKARRARGARNVILIISDSMRRDALGCYGSTWTVTPNLDAFASRSIRFENAFASSFPTVPARHDIYTGTYTFTYKAWSPLMPRTLTLQDVLSGAGVTTALVADTPTPYAPHMNYQRRFAHVERVRGQENDPYITRPVPVHLPCDVKKLRFPEDYVPQYLRNVSMRRSEDDYFCARTMRQAARWLIKNHKRQPFFLAVDTFDPHEPWDPPANYVTLYDPDYAGQQVIAPRYGWWRDVLTPRELEHCRALYAAEATLADYWIGNLLGTIEELGLFENSLILFLSDHGVLLGEHNLIGKGFMRPKKSENVPLYPELCRLPFIVRYPGCPSGTVSHALAQPANLPATIVDYLGIPIPESFVAASLWPVLKGDEPDVMNMVASSPSLSFPRLKAPLPTDRATITDGRWLLVDSCTVPSESKRGAGSRKRVAPLSGITLEPLLFNLAEDPGCLRNVLQANQELAQDIHRRFFEFLQWSPMRRDHLDYFRTLDTA